RRSSGPRRAFPLSLGRETVLAASGNVSCREFPLRKLPAIIGRVLPAYAGGRTGQIAGKSARVCAHDRKELFLGHFIFPDPKAAAECHCGLRTFVDVTVLFVGRAAHDESIGRDE